MTQQAEVKLVKYDAMCRAIEVAHSVDEVKDIRDKAAALAAYNRMAQNTEAERDACEIRLRAERKAGIILRDMAAAKERPSGRGGDRKSNSAGSFDLKDLGITPKQSSQWQKLAGVPTRDFERSLKDETRMPTTTGIIREHSEPKQKPVHEDALWVWGRLCDFERRGLLSKEASEVMLTMTEEMLDDCHRLAPMVAKWLRTIGAAR